MIKDSLKYDKEKDSFYFKTEKSNVYVSKENLKHIKNNITLSDNHQRGFKIKLSNNDTMKIENENYSFPPEYIRIYIGKEREEKEVAFTENVDVLYKFCENPTIELYDKLNF